MEGFSVILIKTAGKFVDSNSSISSLSCSNSSQTWVTGTFRYSTENCTYIKVRFNHFVSTFFWMWQFSKTNSPGCKSTKTLLLHICFPEAKTSHGAHVPDTQTPGNVLLATPGNSFMTQETHLKLQDFISQNINAVFSELSFLQEQPGFAANRKRSPGRKPQPRNRVMITAALAYSTTHTVTLPWKK